MLALWAAAGLTDKYLAATGPLLATDDCIVAAVSVQTAVPSWPRAYDPADRSPYAYNFRPLLKPNERLIAVDELVVSSVGRALGVYIYDSGEYAPTIAGDDADHVQIWPGVEERFWSAPGFDDPGLLFNIRFRVRTNLRPSRRFERRANMTMAQQ